MKKLILAFALVLIATTAFAIDWTKISGTEIEASENVAISSLEWASDTGGTVINGASGEWFPIVNIQVSVGFLAGGTEDAEIHVRKSTDNATTEDTEEEGTYLGTIEYSSGATVTRTWQVYDFDYLDVGCKNTDGAATINWEAQYDGYKITGMN